MAFPVFEKRRQESIYRLYGPPAYINKLKELVNDLIAAGHLNYDLLYIPV